MFSFILPGRDMYSTLSILNVQVKIKCIDWLKFFEKQMWWFFYDNFVIFNVTEENKKPFKRLFNDL